MQFNQMPGGQAFAAFNDIVHDAHMSQDAVLQQLEDSPRLVLKEDMYEVQFHESDSIGIGVIPANRNTGAIVSKVASGVEVGERDELVGINGHMIASIRYQLLLRMINAVGKPITMTFRRQTVTLTHMVLSDATPQRVFECISPYVFGVDRLMDLLTKRTNVVCAHWIYEFLDPERDYPMQEVYKALVRACKTKRWELAHEFLQIPNLDVNSADGSNSPLLFSASHGHIKTIDLLLQRPGIKVNAQNEEGISPLHAAARGTKPMEVIQRLFLCEDLDLNSTTVCGHTTLCMLCDWPYSKTGMDVAELLLSHDRIDVNKTCENGASPFFHACGRGNLELVKRLAEDSRIDLAKEAEIALSQKFIQKNAPLVEFLTQKMFEEGCLVKVSGPKYEQSLPVGPVVGFTDDTVDVYTENGVISACREFVTLVIEETLPPFQPKTDLPPVECVCNPYARLSSQMPKIKRVKRGKAKAKDKSSGSARARPMPNAPPPSPFAMLGVNLLRDMMRDPQVQANMNAALQEQGMVHQIMERFYGKDAMKDINLADMLSAERVEKTLNKVTQSMDAAAEESHAGEQMLDDVIASSPSQTMSSLGIHSVQIPNGPGAPPGGVPGPQVHIIGGNAGPFMQQFQAQNGGISMEQFQEMMNNSNHLDVNQEPAPHEVFSSVFNMFHPQFAPPPQANVNVPPQHQQQETSSGSSTQQENDNGPIGGASLPEEGGPIGGGDMDSAEANVSYTGESDDLIQKEIEDDEVDDFLDALLDDL